MSDSGLVAEIAGLISATMYSSLLGGADFWAKLDLTMPQLKILMLLGQVGSASVSWLAARLDVSPPNVTGILDRLEQHEWVKRTNDRQDRRVVRVVLTPRADQLLRDLNRAGEERLVSVIAGMHDADQVALRQGLAGLLGSVRSRGGFDLQAEADHPQAAVQPSVQPRSALPR